MSILALDPSGDTETGAFFYQDFQNWEVFTIGGKSAVDQGKNLDFYLKNKKIEHLVWETSWWWKTNKAQYSLRELVYFNGIIAYLRSVNYVAYGQEILNKEVQRVLNYELVKVKGLEVKEKQWIFKGRSISVHERDAILVFFVYWTVKLKRPWPWQ